MYAPGIFELIKQNLSHGLLLDKDRIIFLFTRVITVAELKESRVLVIFHVRSSSFSEGIVVILSSRRRVKVFIPFVKILLLLICWWNHRQAVNKLSGLLLLRVLIDILAFSVLIRCHRLLRLNSHLCVLFERLHNP